MRDRSRWGSAGVAGWKWGGAGWAEGNATPPIGRDLATMCRTPPYVGGTAVARDGVRIKEVQAQGC